MIDTLEKYKSDIEYCTFCPKMCRFVCPVGNISRKESLIPTNKMTFLNMYRKGNAVVDERIDILPLYYCLKCLACNTYCYHKIEIPPIVDAARCGFKEEGDLPDALNNAIEIFRGYGNTFKADLKGMLQAHISPDLLGEAQVVYFPGCRTIAENMDNIHDTFRIFKSLGIDYIAVYPGDIQCCGLPLLNMGDEVGFSAHAERLFNDLRSYKLILSGCPSCTYTLMIHYQDYGLNLGNRVRHLGTFLYDHLKRGELHVSRKIDRHVIYHDPCYLCRYLGIYNEPRLLLREVVTEDGMKEFLWSREDGVCCGGGGGLEYINERLAREIAHDRIKGAGDNGADTVVTFCPGCEAMFRRESKGIEVMDVVNVIAEAI